MAEKKYKNVEILAPCGSMESFNAAVNAGCDACYLAGKSFGARAYADNFSEGELLYVINQAHLKGVRVYLTLNTLLKNNEIKELYDYFLPYYENGLDAVIVQDMGVLKFLRKEFPGIPIHCSTQMNICTAEGAEYMKRQGATRIVTARELGLDEIKSLRQKTDLEIETFVHGAMCFSYSGRCLFSSLAGGRSGNRGRCAQPCRKAYNGRYLFSMKDMCTLSRLPEFVEAGIDSLKIEGRMKNEYYTASAVDAYRTMRDDYLNGCFSKEKALKYTYRLASIYNRGGFSEGYFFMKNGSAMTDTERPGNRGVKVGTVQGVEGGTIIINASENIFRMDVLEIETENRESVEITSNINCSAGSRVKLNAPKTRLIRINTPVYRTRCNKLISDIRDEIINKEKKKAADIIFNASPDGPMEISFSFDTLGRRISITKKGSAAMSALNRPTDEMSVYEKLVKLGNTAFNPGKVSISLSEGTFIPMSSLNNLKRDAVSALEEECRKSFLRSVPEKTETTEAEGIYTELHDTDRQTVCMAVSVQDMRQLEAVTAFKSPYIKDIYVDAACFGYEDYKKAAELIRKSGRRVICATPQTVTQRGIRIFDILEKELEISDGVYLRNTDTYAWLMNRSYVRNLVVREGFTVIIASSVYITNDMAFSFFYDELKKKSVETVFDTSKELNRREIAALKYPEGTELEMGCYGYEPLMVTAQCPARNETGGCLSRNIIVRFTDDMNNAFFSRNYCGLTNSSDISPRDVCYNTIYNGIPLKLRERVDNIRRYRLDFTIEEKSEIPGIMDEFIRAIFEGKKQPDRGKYTTGHFNRGIE